MDVDRTERGMRTHEPRGDDATCDRQGGRVVTGEPVAEQLVPPTFEQLIVTGE
jgi:hypothetical protein